MAFSWICSISLIVLFLCCPQTCIAYLKIEPEIVKYTTLERSVLAKYLIFTYPCGLSQVGVLKFPTLMGGRTQPGFLYWGSGDGYGWRSLPHWPKNLLIPPPPGKVPPPPVDCPHQRPIPPTK